jgi:hypothetical protein
VDRFGLGAALGIEAVTIAGASLSFLLGGRDRDVDALFGSRPDERQASINMRSTDLAGNVLILVAIGGVIVTSALAKPVWPFSLVCVVGGATSLVGLVIYRIDESQQSSPLRRWPKASRSGMPS